MKLKNLQWIRKPEKSKIISSSILTFKSESEHALVYTFADDERVAFSLESEAEIYGFGIILNINQGFYALVKDNKLILKSSYMSLEEETIIETENKIEFSYEKCDSTIKFYNSNNLISTITLPSFKESVSIAIITKGVGQTTINFK